MPIRHAIWKISDPPERLAPSQLDSERHLETMIVAEPGILSDEWMLVGQQERTQSGKHIDLLAIAADGSLILIELKRNLTPRDVRPGNFDRLRCSYDVLFHGSTSLCLAVGFAGYPADFPPSTKSTWPVVKDERLHRRTFEIEMHVEEAVDLHVAKLTARIDRPNHKRSFWP